MRRIAVFAVCLLSLAAVAAAATPKAGKWKSTYVELGYDWKAKRA